MNLANKLTLMRVIQLSVGAGGVRCGEYHGYA